jgi:hypothetical protein
VGLGPVYKLGSPLPNALLLFLILLLTFCMLVRVSLFLLFPTATIMSGPARGMWGPGSQPGGGLNHLQGSTGGTATSTHNDAFVHLNNVAHQLLTRTAPGSVIPVNINIPQGPANLNQHYAVWYILDQAVCDELRRIFAFAPVR